MKMLKMKTKQMKQESKISLKEIENEEQIFLMKLPFLFKLQWKLWLIIGRGEGRRLCVFLKKKCLVFGLANTS